MNDNDLGPRIPVEVLTAKEACDTLLVSRSTLRRLVEAGKVEPFGCITGTQAVLGWGIRHLAVSPLEIAP